MKIYVNIINFRASPFATLHYASGRSISGSLKPLGASQQVALAPAFGSPPCC